MKKSFTLCITMAIALIVSTTHVFAESENINFEVAPRKISQRIKNLSILKHCDAQEGLKLLNQDTTSMSLNSNGIDDRYGVKAFRAELRNLKSNLEIRTINQYISSYIEIFNMYKDMDPYLSNKEIAEKAKENMINKIEYEMDDSEYKTKHNTYISTKEPDGYEIIVNYINDNLKPNYYATLETTKENINILKKHMDNLPDKMKEIALLYIEDMELSDKLEKMNANKNLKRNTLSRSSEKDTVSKGDLGIGRIIIPIILIGALIVLIFSVFMWSRKNEKCS